LSLYVETNDASSPPKPSRAFAQWQKIGEEKNQKAFTVAGPCGNFTNFPILLLPEKRQQVPEAKTVLLIKTAPNTHRTMRERNVPRGISENSPIIASSGKGREDQILFAISLRSRAYSHTRPAHLHEREQSKLFIDRPFFAIYTSRLT
jgi:hypothetical protein